MIPDDNRLAALDDDTVDWLQQNFASDNKIGPNEEEDNLNFLSPLTQ